MDVNILSCNVRGLVARLDSFNDILLTSDFLIASVQETHLNSYDNINAFIPNDYLSSNRVRSEVDGTLIGGGSSIIYKKDLKNDCVMIAKGDKSEYIALKYNCFSPPLVVFSYYGPQAVTGAQNVNDCLRELLHDVKLCLVDNNVIINGDFNLHTGVQLVRDNQPNVSKSGQILIDFINENGLHVMNNMTSNLTTTFVDPVHKTQSCLDFVITNAPNIFNSLTIDTHNRLGAPQFTPFNLKVSKGRETKTFADHSAIMYNVTLKLKQSKSNIKPKKIKVWKYSRKDGLQKYKQITNDRAGILLKQIENTDDVNKLVKMANKFVDKSKRNAYGIETMTFSKFKKAKSNKEWKKRATIVDEMYAKASETGSNLRVHKIKDLLDNKFENKTLAAAYDYRNGARLEDLTSIVDMVLDYNYDTLQKAPIPDHLKEISELKKQFIEEQWNLIEPGRRFITWRQYMKAVYKIYNARKSVYLDFINSGNEFKVAIFHLVNKIYASGKIPDAFLHTKPTKIYTRKGSRRKQINFMTS